MDNVTGNFGVEYEMVNPGERQNMASAIEEVKAYLWSLMLANVRGAMFDERTYGMEFTPTSFVSAVVQDAIEYRIDYCVWVKDYKQCKVGEHTKLPFDFPYDKAVYDCHNYVKDGKLWKMVD